MAKKSASGVNKSEAIRNYKRDHADAGPKEIAEGLSKEGVSVSAAFVSTVLSTAKRKGKKGSNGRRKGMAGPGRPSRAGAYENLVQANHLVKQMGGIDKARAALDALAEILGK